MKQIIVGGLAFSRKKDAEAYFKEMLYRYDLGDKVSQADSTILEVLLLKHPEADEKIGPGVASFSVRTADFGTRCFWVNRVDGSSEKFSFRSCLK